MFHDSLHIVSFNFLTSNSNIFSVLIKATYEAGDDFPENLINSRPTKITLSFPSTYGSLISPIGVSFIGCYGK